ncbi:hypothetical protein HYT55_02325 [Candidatus Woesearchaeota archaeon]|nr:hypothetical protein [Candidatus Woesearchaeota archaeon]
MMQIYPSIMARDQLEINQTLKKMGGVARTLHVDVGDGKFVSHKYGWFDITFSKKFKYNAHLMVKSPEWWIQRNGRKVDSIIFHPEPLSHSKIISLINQVKVYKKKVGLALKPETNVASIQKYLPLLNSVLILTVHPGRYGAPYLRLPLKKIAVLKRQNSKIKIIVDGGMQPETIQDAVRAGADAVVSGSFITQAEDPKKAMRELKRACSSPNI